MVVGAEVLEVLRRCIVWLTGQVTHRVAVVFVLVGGVRSYIVGLGDSLTVAKERLIAMLSGGPGPGP